MDFNSISTTNYLLVIIVFWIFAKELVNIICGIADIFYFKKYKKHKSEEIKEEKGFK